jgi:hypothetical protein
MPKPRVVARFAALAVLGTGLAATVPRAILDVLGQRRHEANIRQLAAREGCSMEQARRLYFLARRDGYGAAHRAVFGADSGPGTAGAMVAQPEPPPRLN